MPKELLKKLITLKKKITFTLAYGSTLSSHGHLLMMVACLFDPPVFLTDDEYKEKYHMKVNVWSEVEKPELYRLTQFQPNDNQLLYSEEQVEDLLEVNTVITSSNTVLINDITRIFNSDNPTVQLEAGHQKGGDYFCCLCPIETNATKNIILSLK